MDIRANSKDLEILKKLKAGDHGHKFVLNLDENCDEPVLMANVEVPADTAHGTKTVLRAFANGMDAARAYIQYGYDRITKFCPLIRKPCIGEACQFYQVQGSSSETMTGDCVLNWQFFAMIGGSRK